MELIVDRNAPRLRWTEDPADNWYGSIDPLEESVCVHILRVAAGKWRLNWNSPYTNTQSETTHRTITTAKEHAQGVLNLAYAQHLAREERLADRTHP